MFYAASGMNVSQVGGLRPHILGLVYIFIGFANKNIGKRIMFCHSQAVMFKTLGNGDFRLIDILKISAYKMLPVAQKTFSLIFVSKKQKLKPSQGGEGCKARGNFGV